MPASTGSSSVQLEDGAAPIYRTRREMREDATRLARDLPVTRAEDAPVIGPRVTPTVAFGPVSAPTPVVAKPDAAVVQDAEAQAPAAAAEAPAATPSKPFVARRIADEAVQPTVTAATATSAPAPASKPAAAKPATAATSAGTKDADLFGEVDDVVTSILGAKDSQRIEAPATRRPLDRDDAAAHPRPMRARRAVAVRQLPAASSTRPRTREVSKGRRVLQKLSAAGAIVFIGSLVAVTSLPAEAFTGSSPLSFAFGDAGNTQQVSVDEGAHGDEDASFYLGTDELTINDAVATQTYDETELSDLQAVADTETIGDYYSGTSAMPQVWSMLETDVTQSPFPSLDEVPISSGFGYRWGSFHGGVDMIPGAGTPVFPIANGVVTAVFQGNHPGGGGYMVVVEHNIGGEFYQSWYPHMEAGSIQVEEGQVVDINTQLGAVGSTGNSTGAHLHLEIKNSDYVSIDPLVFLQTREEVLEPTY